jgi:hypothetical protein
MVRPDWVERGLASSSTKAGCVVDGWRGVDMLPGLAARLGGTSDGGGGESFAGAGFCALFPEEGSGSGGIALGDFIGNCDCKFSARSTMDKGVHLTPMLPPTESGSTAKLVLVLVLVLLVLPATLLLAVVAVVVALVVDALELTMTAVPMLALPMAFSSRPKCRAAVLPALRSVWEPDA